MDEHDDCHHRHHRPHRDPDPHSPRPPRDRNPGLANSRKQKGPLDDDADDAY